ncbi:MAG: hypothetical protein HXY20_12805 [Acidobacteria bacterium]|nr:hypothetical protein [Acidobacteriota bacterium]
MRFLMITSSTLSGLLLLGALTTAEAGINQRQRRQEARIRQGVVSGELTRREYRQLERHAAIIARNEARAKADGEFTRGERARINHRLDRQSRQIHRQKHDNQSRN